MTSVTQSYNFIVNNSNSAQLINADVLRNNFIGKWRAFPSINPSNSNIKIGYSDGIHCQYNSNIVLGSRYVHHLNEQQAPNVLTQSTNPNDVPEGINISWIELPQLPNDIQSSPRLPGFLFKDGNTHWSMKQFYAVNSTDWSSQGFADETGNYGLYHGQGVHHNNLAGYLAVVPSDIPGDYLAGLLGSSGVSHFGPNLYVITMDTSLLPDGYLPIQKLLEYDSINTDGMTDKITRGRGCAWIETSQYKGVLFSIMTSVGQVWYGDQTEVINGITYFDPYDSSKGYHAEGRKQELWVYDPNDLRDVLNGTKQPWQPQPVNIIPLLEYTVRDAPHGFVSLSWTGSKLTISLAQGFRDGNVEPVPLILEFSL